MNNIMIITGHNSYASGLYSSLEVIVGKNKAIYVVDFNNSEDQLRQQYNEIINNNSNSKVLFVCDILGGTPFKEASKIAYNNDQIEVIAGCNLGALVQTTFLLNNNEMKDVCTNLIKFSKKHIIQLNKKFKNNKHNSKEI